jgi:molybdenum cofactor cytidylyltransferase
LPPAAAGVSAADKRLHPLADGTVMALAAGRKLAAVCQRTIVVVRPDDMAMTRLLSEAGLESVVCANAAQGMGHSLAAGVAASEDAAGWLVALADMPYIRQTDLSGKNRPPGRLQRQLSP